MSEANGRWETECQMGGGWWRRRGWSRHVKGEKAESRSLREELPGRLDEKIIGRKKKEEKDWRAGRGYLYLWKARQKLSEVIWVVTVDRQISECSRQ
jgi:hypothetical protein